ncbi:Polyphosphate kinase 2 (PPK2) [Planctomycetes bacterium Pla163]|uniref:ADP/GDP-polyphosphate phosphotransferase n=1 Tax=Rohdeia mirabilis TaxID=2528008 RepID=A0A518CUM2_9BACT|nr:Polyphosphate kinase 2 (PPK2) [Planctomycetes bacterium Pla163]
MTSAHHHDDPDTTPAWLAQVLDEELDRDYQIELARLQLELLEFQSHVVAEGKRVAVLFEGRDTAGKGGAIIRFGQHLRPRHVRIVALPKPDERERGQWYFERYVSQLPAPGEVVLFDRSWYNRAVVEPVMGFCTDEQYELFMEQVVDFERMLLDDDLVLVKLWFSIDREEQEKRILDRRTNPLKRWKLSTVDLEAQERWAAFTHYKEAMFARTSTDASPWYVVRGNDKKRARLESIRHVLSRLDYPRSGESELRLAPDPAIVARAPR